MNIGKIISSVFVFLAVFSPAMLAQAGSGAPSSPPPSSGAQNASAGRPAAGQSLGVFGVIQFIKDHQLTLKSPDGKIITVLLTSGTVYRKDRQESKFSDLHVGDVVAVRGRKTGDASWTADALFARSGGGAALGPGLGKEFIAGAIQAMDGTKLTILRPDGQTQVIEVTEDTSFRKDGQSITLPDLKVGDHVFGPGAMKNGVFIPRVLNSGDFRRPSAAGPQGGPGRP